MIRNWTCCGLLLACTVSLGAQSSQTPATPGVPSQAAPAAPTAPPRPRISPQEHLAEAQRALEGVSEAAIPEDGRKLFAQVQKDMAALTAKFGEAPAKSAEWLADLHNIERNVTLLVGSSNGLPAATTDGKDKPSKIEVADPGARAMLQSFRTHIELFYDAATTAGRA
jgi:hypothetical protein